ncbi:MAG: GAF and ANTAR domain-containing protein [Acidimicrobiales bacterium]
MDAETRLRIVGALSAVGEHEMAPTLCSTCAGLVKLSGAAIAVVTEGGHRGVLCSSNPTAGILEDLQTTLGEGPGIDAYCLGAPVADADLARPGRAAWLAFAGPALEAGAAAVFAFPLRVGGVRLGAITFHHDRPGPLSIDQHADALAIAGVVTRAVLAIQAQAPPGMVAAALAAVADDGAEVHQAAGMLSVRLRVSVGEAMVRLRARAYSEGRPLSDVARAVIARRLGMR